MAWTSVGFDGTINEAQWSQMAGLLGNDYVAAGTGDCVVTAVGGARSVSVAAGSLYGDGIVSTNSGAETVAMTTPVNGQWYVIALRRTWATNTAALVAIAGATTTTTTPTAPPTSFPTLNTNKGVLTDQPIAWAWCNSANTTVVVYDIRLKAVKSLPPVVANQGERDAKFMTPTQGLQVWRDDLGTVETYFGLYNSSTNPGGRDSAGWYSNNRSGGFVPIRPSSVTIVSGTGSSNAIGQVSFTNATSVLLNGVFSSEYKAYKVIVSTPKSSATWLQARFATGGTINTASNYGRTIYGNNGAGSVLASQTAGDNRIFINYVGTVNTLPQISEFTIDSPFLTGETGLTGFCNGWYLATAIFGGWFTNSVSFDGLAILPQDGSISGTIQVFGIND